tara:strand:+ start:100 stop:702 length:603 start_codon:yes stop_codon:yes gene_type:complete
VIAPLNIESRKQFIDELKEKNLPFPEIDDEEFWTVSLQNKFLQYVEYIQQEQIADSLLEDSTFSEDEKETHLSDWSRLYQNILAQPPRSKADFINKGIIFEVKSSTNLSEFIDSKVAPKQFEKGAFDYIAEWVKKSSSKIDSTMIYVVTWSDSAADFRLDIEGITIFVDLKIKKVGDKKLEPEWKFSPPLFHGGGRQNDE